MVCDCAPGDYCGSTRPRSGVGAAVARGRPATGHVLTSFPGYGTFDGGGGKAGDKAGSKRSSCRCRSATRRRRSGASAQGLIVLLMKAPKTLEKKRSC